MAVTLSPYPLTTSAAGRTAARDFLKSLISGISEATDDRVDSLGIAASEIVERYSPDAPQELRNEAALRIVAYLVAYMPQPVSRLSIGKGTSVQLVTLENNRSPSALTHSGAGSLLAPFRVHRALPIEEPDS